MDYKALLQKYMQHVSECEGVDFVDMIGCNFRSDVKFTPEELKELQTMSDPVKDWSKA